MRRNLVLFFVFIANFIYAQCNDYNQFQCNNDSSCEWVEDIETGNCGNLWGDDCELNPECNWSCWSDDQGYMGWCTYSCDGGNFEIDNSYCQEIEMPECSEMNELECSGYDSCDWVENIETENCHDILDCTGGCTWQDCEAIEGCWWHFGTAYYDPSGCYGEHEADNSYCEEIEMPECSGMNETACSSSDDCEWFEDISYGSCGALSVSECYDYPGECFVDSNPGWYDSSGPYCAGGTYQIDNSYCLEIEIPECSEMHEHQCVDDSGCDWVEDIQIEQCSEFDNSESVCNDYPGECYWDEDITYGSCSGYGQSSCNDHEGCYWDCSWWYTWACSCYGTEQFINSECIGEYQSIEGTCEDIDYLLGDFNLDGIIDIQDIIRIIGVILNQQYNQIVDMDNNGIINILDVIEIINIVLNQ